MNTKFTIILFVLMNSFCNIYGQQIKDSTETKKAVTRIHLLPIGVSAELEIRNHVTILFDIGAGFTFQFTELNGYKNSEFSLVPYVVIESRKYTNLLARTVSGKRTDYYSGAYGAFKLQGGVDLVAEDWHVQFGPLIGFQRTLGKKCYWNIGIGCGSTIMEQGMEFGLIGDLEFGFIID